MTDETPPSSLSEQQDLEPTTASPDPVPSSQNHSNDAEYPEAAPPSPAATDSIPETLPATMADADSPAKPLVPPADAANPANPPATDLLLAAARETSERAALLKGELEECKSLQKFFEELISLRDKGWILHLMALCDREKDRLKRLRSADHSCIGAVEGLYRDARERAKRMQTIIPSDLQRLAPAAGISIERKSRHPRYFFGKDGFLEAQINDQKLTCTISTREGKLATLPADPGAILEAVRGESNRLFSRDFNGESFLADLYDAYRALSKARGHGNDEDPVPIREIHSQMTKKARGYKRDEFLVDLSTLVEQGPAETSGLRFDLQQTKDTEEGMLLLGEAGRGMVNLLVFKKSNQTPT
jgi:hypothetical protein